MTRDQSNAHALRARSVLSAGVAALLVTSMAACISPPHDRHAPHAPGPVGVRQECCQPVVLQAEKQPVAPGTQVAEVHKGTFALKRGSLTAGWLWRGPQSGATYQEHWIVRDDRWGDVGYETIEYDVILTRAGVQFTSAADFRNWVVTQSQGKILLEWVHNVTVKAGATPSWITTNPDPMLTLNPGDDGTITVETRAGGLSYEWEYDDPSTPVGFVSVPDDDHHDGVTTATLQLVNVSGDLDGVKYRCKVWIDTVPRWGVMSTTCKLHVN